MTAEHELFTDASLGSASGDGKGLISVLSDNLVGVVNVDSDPLGGSTISTDSDVLVPSVDREVVIYEPVLLLSDAEVVKVGLPVFALVGEAKILSVLGGLDGQEDTAGAVVLEESLVTAGGLGEAVDKTAASG